MFNDTETNSSICFHGVHRDNFTYTLLFDLILRSVELMVRVDWQHICSIRAAEGCKTAKNAFGKDG